MRLIDLDAYMAEINKHLMGLNAWRNETPSAENKARAERDMAAISEALVTARMMPIIELGREKKGKWIRRREEFAGLEWEFSYCSNCDAIRPLNIFGSTKCQFNYCPQCGADMRGEEQ